MDRAAQFHLPLNVNDPLAAWAHCGGDPARTAEAIIPEAHDRNAIHLTLSLTLGVDQKSPIVNHLVDTLLDQIGAVDLFFKGLLDVVLGHPVGAF